MTDQATHTTTAGGSPLDGVVRPRAWAIFVDSGNARMWATLQPHVQKLADAEGLEVTPLYDQAAIDAAVIAERARIAEAMRNIARVLHLPDAPQYLLDERHTEKRMLLALADATVADSWPNV